MRNRDKWLEGKWKNKKGRKNEKRLGKKDEAQEAVTLHYIESVLMQAYQSLYSTQDQQLSNNKHLKIKKEINCHMTRRKQGTNESHVFFPEWQ